MYGMVCMVWYVYMHKALKATLDESGTALPWPLNTTGRINTINTTGRINTTARIGSRRDYVEASGN